jgi:hypothetical protein
VFQYVRQIVQLATNPTPAQAAIVTKTLIFRINACVTTAIIKTVAIKIVYFVNLAPSLA